MQAPIEEIFSKTVVIKAAPEAVWAALTQPGQMQQWMSETPVQIETTWQQGSPILISGRHYKMKFENRGGGGTGGGSWTISRYPVPNWANDTLLGAIDDFSGKYDTMYSIVSGGKTYIKYRGVQYEILAWHYNISPAGPAESQYEADIYDMSGKPISDTNKIGDCAVRGYKYYDSTYSKWRDQPMYVLAGFPPFPDSVITGAYTTAYKK